MPARVMRRTRREQVILIVRVDVIAGMMDVQPFGAGQRVVFGHGAGVVVPFKNAGADFSPELAVQILHWASKKVCQNRTDVPR